MKRLLILGLVLIGCEVPTTQHEINSIEYYKDQRTGLCFTVSYIGEYPVGQATVFSNVPCSPEVEKIILQQNVSVPSK